MWQRLAKFVLQFRLPLLIMIAIVTVVMGYLAGKVQLSYEFSKAIPVDNPVYKEYLSFKEKFGDDGNVLVIAIQSENFFDLETFRSFSRLHNGLKKIKSVEDVLSIVSAINLKKNIETTNLYTVPVFDAGVATQQQLDSSKNVFFSLPFYKTILYNPQTNTYLTGVRINREVLNSPGRTKVINDILALTNAFTKETKIKTHISGLPLIRTLVADKIAGELKWFLIGSLALSTLILLLFFRSLSTTILSLAVVIIGVIWSFGVLYMFGYKITLLNALTPPLLVVIGIPNCIYFLNKYHSSYRENKNKTRSLMNMAFQHIGILSLEFHVDKLSRPLL